MSFHRGCLLRIVLALAWLVCAPTTANAAAPAADAARWLAQSDTLFTHHTAPLVWGANALAQDGQGFLWASTQTGLVRWDGYRFRNYAADPQTPGALPDSYILSLYEDAHGRLWIGSLAGGLARHEAANDRFVVYKAGPGGMSGPSVSAITGDGHGGLWVGTSSGLDHLEANDAVRAATPAATAAAALPEGGVQALLNDRADTLWAGTQHGLFRRAPGAAAFSAVSLPLPAGKAAGVITRIFQERSGRIWVGTRGDGAFVIDSPTALARAVQEQGESAALASDTVLSIVEAVPGEIWLGTYGGGILVVDAHGGTRRIRRRLGTASSLSDDDVLALFRDRSGLVWAATSTALSQHDPQQRAVLSLLGATGREDGIRSAEVPFILPRRDGRVWLSQGSGGIDIVDPLLGRVGQMDPDRVHPLSALPKGRVLGMVSGPGVVYLGTRAGLYVSDADGRRVRRVDVPQREPDATVWSLCLDAGVLWMGGLDGLWALDMSDPDRPRVLRHETSRRFGDAKVVSLVRGQGHSLWVGTDIGLVRVDIASGAVDTVRSDAADPVRMAPGFVSSLLLDRRGRLWIASYGNGVLLLEGQDADGSPRFRRLGLHEGLPHTGVDTLLEDARGDIWASTDDGLAVIDATTLAARALQRPQGVGILTYWTNSGAVTATGELLFGGQGGVSVVRPERLVPWTLRPPVVVTEARVGASRLPSGRFGPVAGQVARLDVPSDVRGLWVEYSALDFSAPELNHYAYRLQGFDTDWIQTDSTRRLASYTNLPPGDYTLQLRGSNRDGVWSDPPLAIPVRVLPAWYQTLWSRGLAGLCALGLVAALVQTRTLYLRRRQWELEALVTERTAELQRRGEELRESQRQLEKIAYADMLTGLPNRRLFTSELRHQVAQAQRGGSPFVLLLIDLDGFKFINDTLGHDAGDALLVATAARLLQAVREADRVARMGGDEFAVLLTQATDHDCVDSVCRRITTGLAEPLRFHGATLKVTASLGVAQCPVHAAEPDRLYKAADVALYEAKRAGRNTWRWYGQMAAASATGSDPTAEIIATG